MRKNYILNCAILFLIFLTSCADPPNDSTPVSITLNSVSITGAVYSKAIPAEVKSIKLTISAQDINPSIITTHDIFAETPLTHRMVIANGPSRSFNAKAYDAPNGAGTLIYEGTATKDLNGELVALTISMISVGGATTDGTVTTTPSTFATARSGTSATYDSVSGLMYVFGGYEDETTALGDMLSYNGTNLTATGLPSFPSSTRGFTGAVYNPTSPNIGSYIFGGSGSGGIHLQGTIFYFDSSLSDLSDLSIPSIPESDHTSAAYARINNDTTDNIYIFGGSSINEDPAPPTLHDNIIEFNPTSLAVTTLSVSLPSVRHKTSALYHPGTKLIYIFGGHDGTSNLNEIIAYDPVANSVVTKGATFPTGISSSSAAYHPTTQKIYIFGGVGSSSIYSYDAEADTLTLLNVTLPSAREETSAVHYPGTNKIYIFGGVNGTTYLNEIISFLPTP